MLLLRIHDALHKAQEVPNEKWSGEQRRPKKMRVRRSTKCSETGKRIKQRKTTGPKFFLRVTGSKLISKGHRREARLVEFSLFAPRNSSQEYSAKYMEELLLRQYCTVLRGSCGLSPSVQKAPTVKFSTIDFSPFGVRDGWQASSNKFSKNQRLRTAEQALIYC